MDFHGTFSAERIQSVAAQLQARTKTRRDLVVARKALGLAFVDGAYALAIQGEDVLAPVSRTCLRQLLALPGFPPRFADSLTDRESADVVTQAVNTMLNREPGRHMARMVAGRAVAILSDSYRRVDNDHVVDAVLPALAKAGAQLWDLRVGDDSFSLLAVAQHISGQVRTGRDFSGFNGYRWEGGEGDTQNAALAVKNSETGGGATSATPSILRKVCANFCLWGDAYRAIHVGGKRDAAEAIWLSEETRRKESELVLAKMQDIIAATFDPVLFAKRIEQLNALTAVVIPAEEQLGEVLERVTTRLSLPVEHREAMLASLLVSGDRTQFGVMQALTTPANPVEGAETADEHRDALEVAGGLVAGMTRTAFERLAIVPLTARERKGADVGAEA